MAVVFFAFWVILNGRITWEIAAFGVVLSAALYYFCVKFLDYDPRSEWRAVRCLPGMAGYLWLLVKEIFKANMSLIPIVYTHKAQVKPKLITFHTPLKGHTLQSLLADSITVTPGTITVQVEDGDMTIHCLDDCFAQGIEDTPFQRHLLALSAKEEDKA